jgi:hypothetical protein
MLLMCLPFVIYSATMQMFLDRLSPAPVRVPRARDDGRSDASAGRRS